MQRDMKESLSSTRKADTTHVRSGIRTYIARTCEYGTAKGYERGNFLRPTGEGPHPEPTSADFERLTAYLRAAIDHASRTLDSMEHHRAVDPHLQDVDGMKAAAYAEDTDQSNAFPSSRLPHLCGSAASLMMAIEQAVDCGLLPADPAHPWEREMAAREAAKAEGKLGCIVTPPAKDGMTIVATPSCVVIRSEVKVGDLVGISDSFVTGPDASLDPFETAEADFRRRRAADANVARMQADAKKLADERYARDPRQAEDERS